MNFRVANPAQHDRVSGDLRDGHVRAGSSGIGRNGNLFRATERRRQDSLNRNGIVACLTRREAPGPNAKYRDAPAPERFRGAKP